MRMQCRFRWVSSEVECAPAVTSTYSHLFVLLYLFVEFQKSLGLTFFSLNINRLLKPTEYCCGGRLCRPDLWSHCSGPHTCAAVSCVLQQPGEARLQHCSTLPPPPQLRSLPSKLSRLPLQTSHNQIQSQLNLSNNKPKKLLQIDNLLNGILNASLLYTVFVFVTQFVIFNSASFLDFGIIGISFSELDIIY